jgi:beta-glucosidase/6-phospho-beta-glucosidase/beta-galactosidase/ABC-type amino acid transport substrate-binding protein
MAFPDGFLFGTANADHQVEAYDPACEDVWDLWERSQGLTERGQGTDFWNRYEEDIAAAAAMGCKLFRFSTAWARVEVTEGEFSAQALEHYRNVAECVRSHGMKVMLTLHHFVWPVWLERDHGGMIGTRFPEFFTRYAEQVAVAMAERVDYWITFNEPGQLTFGYIKPWWQNRYYMPPGLPRNADVDAEAEAVGRLIPNLFKAHAQARLAIKRVHTGAKVGVNPLVTGFPTWLQVLMDWGACFRRLPEALFKFTTKGALITGKGDVDLLIGGVTADESLQFETSDPYLSTSKAVIVKADDTGQGIKSLVGRKVGVLGRNDRSNEWGRDLPHDCEKVPFSDYDQVRAALRSGAVDAAYGDAFLLMSEGGQLSDRFRFLATGLRVENYVVVAPQGHTALLSQVNQVVATFQKEMAFESEVPSAMPLNVTPREAKRPASLYEVLHGSEEPQGAFSESRDVRRIQRRGKIRIGIRNDAPGSSAAEAQEGLESKLARMIAYKILGDENYLEIVAVDPRQPLTVLKSKSGWLNWAWRFWGATSLIANVNWWYLGMLGRLPVELCPEAAIGGQDFVGLDYYWGLPTWRLGKFRSLEDAAQGRFIHAPVWPQGLYHALRRFHRWFPDQEIFIIENGSVPMADGISRAEYLRLHIAQVKRAIDMGVPVKGYNFWSITSNREWGHAFDPNTDFGLYFVDLDQDPDLKRVATAEVDVYRNIIA